MSPKERLDQQRAQRLLEDAKLAVELSRRHDTAWERMRADVTLVLEAVRVAKARGETIDVAWLARHGYLDRLERAVTINVRVFLDYSERRISQASVASALAGGTDAQALVAEVVAGASLPTPLAAATPLLADLQAGRPLRLLLDTLPGQTGSRAASALLEGLLLGRGPREIARNIQKVATVPKVRALTIARTETLRAYRAGALERYRQSRDILTGWVWTARLDARTCPVCVALHGTVHELDETMGAHPNCRCTMAPLTREGPDPFTPETGVDWFARQSEAVQRKMLGPAKYDLYASGELQLSELVQPTANALWGPGVRERSLRELRVIVQ